YQTPFQVLKQQLPDVDDSIRYIIPVMLDKASVEIGPWSGYNLLAQYPVHICVRIRIIKTDNWSFNGPYLVTMAHEIYSQT
ncbi:MAG: hypothetical protein Q7J07_10025, partial [Pelolinea sp.]|nr:hypothetical protein [Pelolinea sp.]